MRSLLDAEPDIEVIGSTDSGIHAMVLARTRRPDVILTGLHLQGLSGLDLITRLRAESGTDLVKVVVLAMDASDETIDTVLHAEVHGLLTNAVTTEELSSAVRSAARGHTTLAPEILERLLHWFRDREPARADHLRPLLADLTARERQVLLMAARGLSAQEIAAGLIIGVTTVRTHLYRLRCKLQLRDRAQLVSFAYESGLMEMSGSTAAA